jgi:hypothetical protein
MSDSDEIARSVETGERVSGHLNGHFRTAGAEMVALRNAPVHPACEGIASGTRNAFIMDP